MIKLILIRHGKTELNSQLRYQGISDHGLNQKGMRQAKCLAQRLSEEPIAAIYSSALRRAVQTATVIAESHQLEVVSIAELNELNFGQWEGLTAKEIAANYPEAYEKWLAGNPDTQIPGGESINILYDRVKGAIESLCARHSDEVIVVVTHGGPIKSIFSWVLGFSPSIFWKLRQDNAALNVIEIHDNYPVITLLNDTCHYQE